MLTYYVEVNLIAIFIAAILIRQTVSRTSRGEFSNIVYLISLGILIVMCVGDIAGLISDSRSFPAAHFVVLAGNSIYLAASATITFTWMMFFQIRLKMTRTLVSQKTILFALPLILFFAALIINLRYGFLFSVDSNHTYLRGKYISFHWITEVIYVSFALIQLFVAIIRAKTRTKRKEYFSYLSYYIPALLGGLLQAVNIGASTLQIGTAISSLLAFLQFQDSQLIRDELTSLNNRRALHNYEDSLINSGETVQLTMFMIDVDFFKHINDTYGHVTGDEALIQIAQILKRSLTGLPGSRLILFRYAGDEFVLAGNRMDAKHIRLTLDKIQQEVEKVNSSGVNPYKLSLSVGYATGECKSSDDFSRILQLADEKMYQEKALHKETLLAADPSLATR